MALPSGGNFDALLPLCTDARQTNGTARQSGAAYVPGVQVPEPASLALVGLALFGALRA